VTSTCNGAASWSCAYKAATYQSVESLCDGLDNDCNGLTDEGCGCVTGKSKMYVARLQPIHTVQHEETWL